MMDLNQIKTRLARLIKDVLQDDSCELESSFTFPEKASFGFLTSNIAFRLAKSKGKKLQEFALSFAAALRERISQDESLSQYIAKVELAGGAFINFFSTDKFYLETLKFIQRSPQAWGQNNLYRNKTILIEFTDPNPFKEFHIGHLMSNCIGEALARLYEFAGAKVIRLCYQGDVGLHVAKTLWAWRKDIDNHKIDLAKLKQQDLTTKIKYLGEWYARGSQEYESDNLASQEEIRIINKLIFERSSASFNELYDMGRQWSLDAFELIYKKLGTKFQKYYFESETGKLGEKIVQDNLGKIFIKSQGAVLFPGEQYGLHNRVFINSQGLPTYEAKEIGLAIQKSQDFRFDKSLIVTGNEVNEYFKVLLCALGKINPQLASQTIHIGHGMLRLPQGKMSSRTGNVITGDKLINIVADKIKTSSTSDRIKDDSVFDILAVSALKFTLLKQNIGKDVVFNLDESISLTGATGMYLQYTHARLVSLLSKVKLDVTTNLQFPPKMQEIVRNVVVFPHIISSACAAHAPSLVANYLLNLAQLYNTYYSSNRILGSEDEKIGLALSLMVKQTLAAGLWALGISPVEAM